jgi:hypothetical protein
VVVVICANGLVETVGKGGKKVEVAKYKPYDLRHFYASMLIEHLPAPAVDENAGRISGGGVAAHHDIAVAAPLGVGIEDRFAGRTPPRLGTLENRLFSTNPSDEMLY